MQQRNKNKTKKNMSKSFACVTIEFYYNVDQLS